MREKQPVVFVFGSNEAGIHGKGAAKTALTEHGAVFGKSYGHYGNSFAIPTKDLDIRTITDEDRIYDYILGFLAYAEGHPKIKFQVTRIGCGLAGLQDATMASMFIAAPHNCMFDEAWRPYLGDSYTYWGTF